jgi:hypothetical protein
MLLNVYVKADLKETPRSIRPGVFLFYCSVACKPLRGSVLTETAAT